MMRHWLRSTARRSFATQTSAVHGHSRRTEAQLSPALSVLSVPLLADNYGFVAFEPASRVRF